jgi:FMN hydrolase / 5-amino-6-(5-phospho-D-ribitylamino)uracil phosphatase
MPIKAILWDVMDTLVADPFRDVMPSFFGMTLERMLREKHPTAWGRFERGELEEAEFLATFFADGRSFDTGGFRACVRGSYRWLVGIEELLADLQARGTSMHTLSNYPEWYAWIEEQLQLSRYVKWSFVSCKTGLRKPDPAAFQLAARALEHEPEECLFIDDRLGNCEGARAIGMDAVHFTGDVPQLRAELARRGLLQN